MTDTLVLFAAAFAAAVVSGAAGFGGALLLLPLLAATVGVRDAVPLLTVAQLIGNLSRAGFGFAHIRWASVGLFMLGAAPMSIAGALAFVELPHAWVTRAIGAALLFLIALRAVGAIKFRAGPATLVLGGGLVGFLSGLVGSAGPLGAAVFLSLGLPPMAYIASEAATALAMHGIKTLVYQRFITLDPAFWSLAAWLGVAMVLGTWVAKRVVEHLPRTIFQRSVTALLAGLAVYMLIHG